MANKDQQLKQLDQLIADVDLAYAKLGIHESLQQVAKIKEQMAQPNFWSDSTKAQKISKNLSRLEQLTQPWRNLSLNLADLKTLLDSADQSTQASGETLLEDMRAQSIKLKTQTGFTGKYDDYDPILNIYAGAGGTDAQDWTQMLLRMYIRWADSNNIKHELLSESRGDEAGLKSASVLFSKSAFLYGRLKSEVGVHRLVRLSPFNADNLRQTSFARVEILPAIEEPDEVVIPDSDLKVDVFRSSGHGGQSVNTTDSAVRLTHKPTGIVVSIQNERSQIQNRETALKILRSRLAQLQLEQHATRLDDLKGPQQANEWGSQIRNYILHPYKLIKDLRTNYTVKDNGIQAVLDGDIDGFIESFLLNNLSANSS